MDTAATPLPYSVDVLTDAEKINYAYNVAVRLNALLNFAEEHAPKIEELLNTAGPQIESMMNHPMLKMLGLGRG